MKSVKNRVIITVSLLILLASLAFTLCDALIPLEVWTHPILNFLFCLCVGFGTLALVLGFCNASPWYMFLSSVLLGLAFFYAAAQYVIWWLCLIIVAVVWACFAIISVARAGNMTEDIALNKSPDYKTFEQKKAENKAAEATEENAEKKLPEIKSFKN